MALVVSVMTEASMLARSKSNTLDAVIPSLLDAALERLKVDVTVAVSELAASSRVDRAVARVRFAVASAALESETMRD
jgi:hypothetical protein